MARLTEEMVHARTRQSNLSAVSKLNCWGSELQDVSLIRRLPNVETLSLSVNKIRSLADFQHCKKLQHLFVRKNDIRDLNQVCYLRDLPELSTLWLAENPCATGPGYRMAVIKALPRLEKLDDVPVTTEERMEAQRHGAYLPHPDSDEPHQENIDEDHETTVYQDELGMSEAEPRRILSCVAQSGQRSTGQGSIGTDACVAQDTDEQYVTRSNHYTPANVRNPRSVSPEFSPPSQSNYMRSAVNSYGEESVQSNGYEPSYDHAEDDYRPASSAIHITPNHHRTNKDLVEDDSPPRSIKQDEDHEDVHPRGLTRSRTDLVEDDSPPRSIKQDEDHEDIHHRGLTRSRTESLPRLSRLEVDDSRLVHPRCRLQDSMARGRVELDDPDHRPIPRSRTVDMLGGHHAGSLSSLHERRLKPCELYMPRSHARPRNINVLNAVLCLIKELELQDLELVAMSVNCRIDELRV